MTAKPDPVVSVARNAMATRFEIVLPGGDPARLRAAGEEALDEIERLDATLSPYRATSEIFRLNEQAAEKPVRVSTVVFRLLQQAKSISAKTGGAFDLTVGPLMQCWKSAASQGRIPTANELAVARASVGMQHVLLDETKLEVCFIRPGIRLDVGAIGKGFALERAVEILREAGVAHALLHGGTSTVCALGLQPDGQPWKIAIDGPPREDGSNQEEILATVSLRDESLSVSAVWGKMFRIQRRDYGHILDPRTGQPAENFALAAVVLPSATETDAFSTALLITGGCVRQTGIRSLLLPKSSGKEQAVPIARGIETRIAPVRS